MNGATAAIEVDLLKGANAAVPFRNSREDEKIGSRRC
jgi:hypothetical protein